MTKATTDAIPETRSLVEGLGRFERLEALRASQWFAANRAAIERLLATPLEGGENAVPLAPPARLRFAQWNVEKGLRFEAIARAFEEAPRLASADVVFLEEVDLGMARSGNRHVARELAARLGMHWVFAPAHLELTKGVGAELDAPGENAVGLQGNAILSRYPLLRPRVVALPVCFEVYHFSEKRYGRRVGVAATVETARGPLALAGTHLEVRETPACRARQMRALLDALPRRGAAVVAGDLNVSTFARGSFGRTLRGATRLMGDPERLLASLVDPRAREPLFLELKRAGLEISGWNTAEATIVERIEGLEDADRLPPPLRRAILERIARLEGRLPMRLDWFAARGLRPSSAATLHDLDASDHDAIVVDGEMA